MSAEGESGRRALLLDGALLATALALGLWLHQPGVFTVDESHYLLAAHALASRGDLRIENGYEATRDPALLFFYTVVPTRLAEVGTVATVPPLQAALAAPLLGPLGLRALVLLNLLAFGLSLVAVRRLVARVHPGRPFQWLAVALFGLASFSLEYALGLWPHALSQALVAWTLLALCASAAPGPRGALAALGCGLLLGLAVLTRLQNALLLPALLAAALVWPRPGARRLGLVLAGWLACAAALGGLNAARLGTWNPFTYGSAEERSGPLLAALHALLAAPWLAATLAIAGALALGAAFWAWRRTRRPWPWWALAGLGLAGALLIPATRHALLRTLGVAGFHLIDSSLAPADFTSVGAHFNALGQVLYGGVLKKALWESAPHLVLVLGLLLPARARAGLPRAAAGMLTFALLGLLLLPFVLSAGGLSHNPRYLLELLPALSVGCLALAWPQDERPGRPALRAALAGVLLGLLAALPMLAAPGSVESPAGGLVPMLLPLGLALGLLLALGLARLGPAALRPAAGLATLALFAAGAAHAGAVHLGLDVPASLRVRGVAAAMLAEARAAVPDGATFVVWEGRKDVFSPLKLERDVWLAGASGASPARPVAVDLSLGRRPVVVLEAGMPPGLLDAWSAGLTRRVETRRGLRFVELLPAAGGGSAP